jgi:two-component system KDP operon response regulator KdpE
VPGSPVGVSLQQEWGFADREEHRAMPSALIVDGDPRAADVLRVALGARGYDIIYAPDVAAAQLAVGSEDPQVIMVGDLADGLLPATLAALRSLTTAPIIVLSDRDQPKDKVEALDAGADDHVVKPFDVDELLARVRAALRRAAVAAADGRRGIVDTSSFAVDLDAGKVWRDGGEVRLSPTEWRLLEMLIRREGRLVTKQELLHDIWGLDHRSDNHYLRVYIGQLRRKLEPDPAYPRHLITESGRGYSFHTRAHLSGRP